MNNLYRLLGLTKQAVHQQHQHQLMFEKKLAYLVLEADILRKEHPGCGVEKMYYTLRPDFLGRDRFIDIFMGLGYRLVTPENRIKTTFPVHSKYKNLINGLLVTHINQVVQSDISYFLLGDTFYYLVFIIDVYSKRIVGYQVSDHMRATANKKALKQLIKLRGKENLNGLIHHADRGSQYIATQYTSLLNELDCFISMGLNAQDNAYAERINGIIKNEYLNLWNITSFAMLKRKLKEAVLHYNYKRIHNHLPLRMSPVEFENAILADDFINEHLELIFAKENKIHRPHNNFFDFPLTPAQGYFCPIFEQ